MVLIVDKFTLSLLSDMVGALLATLLLAYRRITTPQPSSRRCRPAGYKASPPPHLRQP